MMMLKEEADTLMEQYRNDYKSWKESNRTNKSGFFIIYNHIIEEGILKKISGNAFKLYVYLGIHARNETGELWHSVEKIADYFECDKRSVNRWFNELEELNLIKRIQKGYKRIANTFLLKY